MSFYEKSAWIMLVAVSVVALFCAKAAIDLQAVAATLSPEDGRAADHIQIVALTPFLVGSVVALIAIVAVGHAIVAALAPKEANANPDEREKQIIVKAGHYSGYVLGFGVVAGLLHFLFNHDGTQLFFIVLASFVISTIFEYAAQIVLFRRAF